MILDLLPYLASQRIVLASQSPRRVALMTQLGLSFTQRASAFPEDLDKASCTPAEYVVHTARGKAEDVAATLEAEGVEFDILVSCDTVVVRDGEIMEKPADEAHARSMLAALSGRSSSVCSGVVVMVRGEKGEGGGSGGGNGVRIGAYRTETFSETTTVSFAVLSEELIDAYVRTGEPMDKAGGYGIQGIAGSFVHSIDGCYYNVMGFPMHRFTAELKRMVDPSGALAKRAARESETAAESSELVREALEKSLDERAPDGI
jgi:septum formation protein